MNSDCPEIKYHPVIIPKFKIGDLICKPKGYAFDGIVVAVFTTIAMEVRVVAEMQTENGSGMLHIFSEGQLEHRAPSETGLILELIKDKARLDWISKNSIYVRDRVYLTLTREYIDEAMKAFNGS